jgi:UDP-2-acetamido-3-amino-2,3-dideoxy-glucuronate N-acetyltransferase
MNDRKGKKIPQIAVIGSGYWGKNLVRNFNQIGALRLICDRSGIILEKFREQFPGIKTCLALSDVLKDENVEGVAIATPAETHYSLVKEALLGGKNVYVEKPLVLDENEAEELITLADRRNLVLMVGHLLQYHPIFVKLKNLAGKGQLGRINYIYSHRLNLGKIRREENILWSFAPHDISMILSLTGEMPDRTFATGGNYLHKQIADVTITHMEFPSGLKAHIFVSWLHPFKEQKLVVVGDKKMAVFDDTLPWEDKLLLYPHQIGWQNNSPVPIKGQPERIDIPQDEPLKLECQHFLDCIARGAKPITDGREGLRVLKVLNDAQSSLDIPSEASQKPSRHKQNNKDDFFVHDSAVLDDGCKIGKGTKIWHFSHILANSIIGQDCNLGQNVVVGPDTIIGDKCKIQNNVSVYKGVTLEDGVFCGPSMVFTNIYNPRAEIRKMDQVRPTLVKKGATLGANCTIVCGTTIGRYAFIGAGAVVNRNIQDHALVVGNPAKSIGWVCSCGERLSEDLTCLTCERCYAKTSDGIACCK